MFKILCLDVDGTLAGNKFYDQNHKVIAKQFNDKDFTAIKRFKAAGIPVIIISADPWNLGMANARNLEFWNVRDLAPDLDKSKLLPAICQHYLVDPSQICYIGDDLFDAGLLQDVGFKFCPNDACYTVQEVVGAANVFNRKGGEGVVDALFQMFKGQLTEVFPDDSL